MPLSGVKSFETQSMQPTGVGALQPRGNRVLIRRLEENTNFVLTDAPKSIKGIVLAIGPEVDTLKPAMLVLFNSRWNDLAHAENVGTGADGKGPLERPLSYKLDPLTHLVTEDDIFCILSEDVQASYVGTAVEAQYFKNTSSAEECFTTRVRPR